MDWVTTFLIIGGVFGVTGVIALFIPKDRDPEINSDNGDGPVIPTPGVDGSMMGAGGRSEDADMGEVEEDHLEGPV